MLGDFKNIEPIASNILINEIRSGKVKHAYMFDVTESKSYMKFIYAFIKSVLCKENNIKNDNCNKCNLCSLIDNSNYPDIYIVEPDGNNIKKEQLLNLKSEVNSSSLYNSKKIYIIKYAEDLHPAAANSILKFLEEPENDVMAILLTKNINNVISTIISRCEK